MENPIPLSAPAPASFNAAFIVKQSRRGLVFAALALACSIWSITAFAGVPLAGIALVFAYQARRGFRESLLPESAHAIACRAVGWAALLRCAYLIVRFFASRAVSAAILPEQLQAPGMPWILRTASRFVFTRLLLYFAGLR